ncbi:MAG: hypothetical protein IJ766_06760 [Clostridia bacterium]|nr:hypothetical protein [Clostridia bacterium]
MEKAELCCQRYILRVLGVIPFVLGTALLTRKFLDQNYSTLSIFLLFAVVYIYYIISGKLRVFQQICTYDASDGVLRLTKGKKTYTLSGVTELMGWSSGFFNTAMYHISIQYAGGRLRLHSRSTGSKGKRTDDAFDALIAAVVEYNPQLRKEVSYSGNIDCVYRADKSGECL